MRFIGKILASLILVLCSLPAMGESGARGRELATLLRSMREIEQIHPDSVESNMRKLETYKSTCSEASDRAVCAAVLGKLYIYNGSQDQGKACFAEALADMPLLADTRTELWTPVVQRGNREEVFGSDMLSVVWYAMTQALGEKQRKGLPAYRDIVEVYRQRGNRTAMLQLMLDSVGNSQSAKPSLLKLREEYADELLCAEVYHRLAMLTDDACEHRDLLQEAIKKYPKYWDLNELKNELTQLSDPTFSWEGPTQVYPGKQYTWCFNVRNIQSVSYDGVEHRFPQHETVQSFTDSIQWTAPEKPGIYTITFIPSTTTRTTDKVLPIEQKVRVSALQMVAVDLPGKKFGLLALDAETGRPQQGVTFVTYTSSFPEDTVEWKRVTTDERGRAVIPSNRDKKGVTRAIYAKMLTADETDLPIVMLRRNYYWQSASADSTLHVNIYTDRAIYRPGQQVHVGGVAYRKLEWDAHVSAGRLFTVSLLNANYEVVAKQDVTTDEMGVFSADFTLPKGEKLGGWRVRVDNYATTYIRVEEYKRPTFEVKIDDLSKSVEKTDTMLTVTGRALNYDGTPVRAGRVTGTYRWHHPWIWRGISDEEKDVLDTIYTDDRGVFSYTLPIRFTQEQRRWTRMLTLNVDVLNGNGETHHAEKMLRVIDAQDAEPVEVDSTFWLRCDRDTFDITHPAEVVIGTNKEDAWITCLMFATDEVCKDTLIRLSSDSLRLVIPYKKEYEQGCTLCFCMQKGERFYTKYVTLYLKQPDTRLRVRWDTFRDKVRPGDKEEWRLTLMNPDGTPATASMIATVYDASLEQFAHHGLSINRYFHHRTPYAYMMETGKSVFDNETYNYYAQKLLKTKGWFYSYFHEGFFVYRKFMVTADAVARPMMKSLRVRGTGASATALNANQTFLQEVSAMESAEEEVTNDNEQNLASVAMRENFSELAYFSPSLRTDNKGQVSICFTLPDCVTTWRLQAVAHTQDMFTADILRDAVASKELMALLSLPRFVRQGDEVQLTATIKNVSEVQQSGNALLVVCDAQSGQVIKQWKCKFDVMPLTDSVYHFTMPIEEACGDLMLKWVAEGKDCSDGEQRLLPVLSAMEHVTNTQALWLNGEGLKEYDLTGMFPEESSERQLTVQYTTHPEQLALQCLPELAVTRSNSVLSLAAAYYAGCLAKHLGMEVPDSSDIYLHKIQSLQTDEGAVTWYPGMPASPYLTREVAFLLTRLRMMTGITAQSVLYKMVRYLAEENSKMIAEWKKEKVEPRVLPLYLMHNLYVLVNNENLLDKKEKGEVDYLLKLLANTELDTESSALATVILQKAGEKSKAKSFLKQATRLLVSTDQQGTYIEHRKGGYTSIDRKIAIHVQIMEALQAVQPENDKLPRMRRWLLQQKRTQQWDTPVNSANAVFALLNGVERRADNGLHDVVTLTKAGQKTPINFFAQEDTIGYICDTVAIDNHLPEKLRIHKLSAGDSWGAVYAHFSQPYRQVEQSATGLKVEIKYPESMVAGSRAVAVLTVEAERDCEYVTISLPFLSATEPVNAMSGYVYDRPLSYYREVHDALQEMHFYQLPRGKYEIEIPLYVERSGIYNTGIATVECTLAPEFQAHSSNKEIRIR